MAEAVQTALQAVAQGTGWTYSVLWRLCPHQGVLVWAGGHYNGVIKTLKTTVPAGGGGGEEEATAAARRRSRQLRELYDSLAGEQDEAVVVARRPGAAALAPEDLAETEWFYLMCASYCYPPGLGLPGEAFARRGHVWLCGANKVDSKVFSRAILARSAGIQTVACIPVNDDGVLEIGTTEKVDKDIGLIQYARSIFMDHQGIPRIPISGHSTSTPSTHINHQPFQRKKRKSVGGLNVQPNNLNPEEKHIETEDDNDRIDSETNTAENDPCRLLPQDNVGSGDVRQNNARNSGLIETLGSIRDGFCTNHVDEEIPMLLVCQNAAQAHEAVLAQNAHYIKTVLTVLQHNACRRAASNIKTYLALSKNSSFSRWYPKGTNDLQRVLILERTPQRMLKSILFISAPSSSLQRHRGEVQPPDLSRDDCEGTDRGRPRRRQTQAELSTSHVVKERQRREKLNERFVILRSLVPFVTKMDRASILGDTIEYVKQLRRRVQDLETHATVSKEKRAHVHCTSLAAMAAETRSNKVRVVEASSSCSTTGGMSGRPAASSAAAASTEVQVSIIESDALLELRCPHRDGLLLRVMQALHWELGLEVTSVQATSAGNILLVELRAKVKEVHGRRSSINEVKRMIHLILSSY